jgi:hypothetical protein
VDPLHHEEHEWVALATDVTSGPTISLTDGAGTVTRAPAGYVIVKGFDTRG